MSSDYIQEDDFICECVKNFCRDSIPLGRPPWYGHNGVMQTPFVIGITGGTGAGKSTMSSNITKALSVPWVANITLDSFYRELTPEQMEKANRNEFNFDRPEAIDHEFAVDLLTNLKNGKKVEVPIYNYSSHTRMKETITIYGANVIIVEGLYALHFEKLRDLMDLKIFIDADEDIRCSRVLKRDMKYRATELKGLVEIYLKFVKPSFEDYIIQSRKHADMIINWNKRDDVSISITLNYVRREYIKRSVKLRRLLRESVDTKDVIVENFPLFYKCTNEVIFRKFLHAIKSESCEDSVFYGYCECLANYLLKFAMMNLNKKICSEINGQETHEVVGVSVLRSGQIFQNALKQTFSKNESGLIFIKTNVTTDEPELQNVKLPRNLSQKKVILMEGFSRSGAALTMAVRVLLDHDVKEEDIFVTVIFVEKRSICAIKMMFPKINMFFAGVDMFDENKKLQNNIFSKLKVLTDDMTFKETGVHYS